MFGWTQGFTSIKCASFASMQIFKNYYLRLCFRYFKPWLENDFEAYYFLQVRYYYFCPTLTYRYSFILSHPLALPEIYPSTSLLKRQTAYR